jgi:hypothetical protein
MAIFGEHRKNLWQETLVNTSNEPAIYATTTIVLPFHRTHTLTELMRCTIVPPWSELEIGCGFFEDVCTLGNATTDFRDPPLPRSTKTGALAMGL